MRISLLLIAALTLASITFQSCSNNKTPQTENNNTKQNKSRFRGDYKNFNDLHDKHMQAALAKGISPLKNKSDTTLYIDKIVKLPAELNFYKIDKLTHSIPYLVKDASELLVDIGINFQDSLRSKNLPAYKIIVTSITRTDEDVSALTKRNTNASENSVHRYATTFDISWKRFLKIGPEGKDDIRPEKLKLILGEVLYDLREDKRCFIKHEKKQACFHITVR